MTLPATLTELAAMCRELAPALTITEQPLVVTVEGEDADLAIWQSRDGGYEFEILSVHATVEDAAGVLTSMDHLHVLLATIPPMPVDLGTCSADAIRQDLAACSLW